MVGAVVRWAIALFRMIFLPAMALAPLLRGHPGQSRLSYNRTIVPTAILSFPLPLPAVDCPPTVDLKHLFTAVYDAAGYQYRLGYPRPVPPLVLFAADQAWVDELLAPLRSPGIPGPGGISSLQKN